MVRLVRAALITLALNAASAVAEEEHLAWLRIDTLHSGQSVRLTTAQTTYRLRLVNPQNGEARVAQSLDGQHFSKSTRVFLVGATTPPQAGDSGFGLVLMGELHEGMCIEWGWGSLDPAGRRNSEPLTGILLEPPTVTPQQ